MTEKTDHMTKTPNRRRPSRAASLPGVDILSDVLGLLTLRGEVFCRTLLSAPWAMAISRQTAYFHVIEAGAIWFQVADSKVPFEAVAGDLVVLPHGDGHIMMD